MPKSNPLRLTKAQRSYFSDLLSKPSRPLLKGHSLLRQAANSRISPFSLLSEKGMLQRYENCFLQEIIQHYAKDANINEQNLRKALLGLGSDLFPYFDFPALPARKSLLYRPKKGGRPKLWKQNFRGSRLLLFFHAQEYIAKTYEGKTLRKHQTLKRLHKYVLEGSISPSIQGLEGKSIVVDSLLARLREIRKTDEGMQTIKIFEEMKKSDENLRNTFAPMFPSKK